MTINKVLLAKARLDRKKIADLTVAEFRDVMQECFIANDARVAENKARQDAYNNMVLQGVPMDIIQKRLSQTIFYCQ